MDARPAILVIRGLNREQAIALRNELRGSGDPELSGARFGLSRLTWYSTRTLWISGINVERAARLAVDLRHRSDLGLGTAAFEFRAL